MAYTLEKKILTEFVHLYRDNPCLWNTSHALYSNKVFRNRAYDVLLEKYKELDSLADRGRVKKKIENMRTTYKREHHKVIKSQLTGSEVYEPSLWYYHEMKFLDELNDPECLENTATTPLSLEIENTNDDGDEDEDERSKSPPAKKPKPTRIYLSESDNDYIEPIKKSSSARKTKKASVFVAENDNDFQEESSYLIKNEPSDNLYIGTTTESDLYGRTIAAQLNELRPKQRFIAEKLISDVIFFGRLDKLKTGTTLNLKNDCF